MSRTLLAAALMSLAILTTTTGATWASSPETLVIYSGRSDRFVKPVADAFTHRSGIKVVIHAGSSTELLNKLIIEGPRTSADLFISNDAGTLQNGSTRNLFAPLDATVAENIPANYRASDNSWIGLSARARVLVVNRNSALAKDLHSVFDLARPALKGRIGITNSTNESFVAGVTVYQEAAGAEQTRQWLTGLKSNTNGNVFAKHNQIVSAVASGKIDVGLVNHYYILRHLETEPNAPIAMLIPDQGPGEIGAAWNVAGVAISRYSQNRSAAERFVRFAVSAEGQQLFAAANAEYPTRSDVAAGAGLPPLTSFRVADVPMERLGAKRDATIDLIEAVALP